jgi:membrane-bound lytic murein transglycosylase D
MAPRSISARHQLVRGIFSRLGHGVFWFGLVVAGLLAVTGSRLEARTEPGMEADAGDTGGVSGGSRTLNGETVRSPLNNSPQPMHYNYSKDFPEQLEANLISIPDHPAVQKYRRFYQREGRDTFASALQSSWAHVPQMAEILKSYGIPPELVYMVLVESSFRNHAKSPKGAAGCWQLMPGTARRLGLRVCKAVDERFDSVKSTHAAAKYLRSLHAQFSSWPLAVAAYNSGRHPVSRAMRHHREDDFWELAARGAVPGQTAAFVAKVYAAIALVRDLDVHGSDRTRYLPGDTADFVWVHSELSLQQVAQWVGSSVQELRVLNPALLADHVPIADAAFCLRLPAQTGQKFSLAYQQFLGN